MSLSASKLVIRSAVYHWKVNLAVLLGVAAATSVLTGALLVGESVRGSLKDLAIGRLGRIDHLLISDRFFSPDRIDDLTGSPNFKEHFSAAVPGVLLPSGTIEFQPEQVEGSKEATRTRRASGVMLVGVNPEFWKLGNDGVAPAKPLIDEQIALNQPLADELNVRVGDTVNIRFAGHNQVPADSPLGRTDGRIESLIDFEVVSILPAKGLGRFSLQPSQAEPLVAFLPQETLADGIGQDGKINLILVAGKSATAPAPPTATEELSNALKPTLADFGLSLTRFTRAWPDADRDEELTGDEKPEEIYDYWSLTSDRLLIAPAAEEAATIALKKFNATPISTYLANRLELADAKEGSRVVPYSTLSAIENGSTLTGELLNLEGEPIGPIGDDEIVLNEWTAAQLKAEPGDKIKLTFFDAESVDNNPTTQTKTFTLHAITPLVEPVRGFTRRRGAIYDQPPARGNDPDLTPTVEGVTDQTTIAEWDPPFPMDNSLIQGPDDDYWANHRTTPKAFVNLETGKKLWGSRFGDVTSFLIPAAESVTKPALEEALVDQLQKNQGELGFAFQPIKRRDLAAASGTTPFDVLFLMLSMFIIAAAILLVALLFRLGVEQRAEEMGLLLAGGFTMRRVSRLLVAEGAVIAFFGSLVGVLAGIGYGWLMIYLLTTIWVGAIVTPFLTFHVGTFSLVAGLISGVIVSLLTIWWSVRGIDKTNLRGLLGGQLDSQSVLRKPSRWPMVFGAGLLLVAVALAGVATQTGGEAQAGAFVSAGLAGLIGVLLLFWSRLRSLSGGNLSSGSPLIRLATQSAGRHALRSTLTMGLTAIAVFLIVATSVFRISPSLQGAGGFAFRGVSSDPIYVNLNDKKIRQEYFGDDAEKLAGMTTISFRYRAGQDASCNNLYQSSQPSVWGISRAAIEYYDQPDVTRFEWAASETPTKQEFEQRKDGKDVEAEGYEEYLRKVKQNPWQLLAAPVQNGEAIPVVIDKNTAMYALQLYGGIGEEFTREYPGVGDVKFRVVGLLAGSILQGGLIVGEGAFEDTFPDVSGYRYFLFQPPTTELTATADDAFALTLEDRFSDEGLDLEPSTRILEQLFAVQNTYISTFQSLGAIGLLLGTFGLATVQLRSMVERRGELALLRAIGFGRSRILRLVLLENLVLLLGGLGAGVIAATLAVIPQAVLGGAGLPHAELYVLLAIVTFVGMLSGFLAVRGVLSAPLLEALRRE
jgi:putative ABC transport system permease protein